MEAIFLVCGAGGPQLKRNPLYSGGHHDKGFVVFRCARHNFQAQWPASTLGRTNFQQLVPGAAGKPASCLEASTAAAV